MPEYDAIVIGLGAMGSAAAYHLARRGAKVHCIEQFQVGHDRGSSHGETRIIRKAYFEHPDYVPLLLRAYALWGDLERESRRDLFVRCGLLLVGRANGVVVSGVKRSTAIHDLALESIPIDALSSRFPGFAIPTVRPAVGQRSAEPNEFEALFEADAGVLRVEACVATHAELAVARGATIDTGQTVESWESDGDAVRVRVHSTGSASGNAERRVLTARSLLICGGPWAGQLISELHLPLKVRRKVQLWFSPRDERYQPKRGCPAFCFDTPEGFYYGAPQLSGEVKVAEHSGGEAVDDPGGVERQLSDTDTGRVVRFVASHLPGLNLEVVRHSVCLYTMTPDEHFIVDRHPIQPNVFMAAGFSGHGFKFAPVIGSVMADFAESGGTREPVDFLSISRPGLRV